MRANTTLLVLASRDRARLLVSAGHGEGYVEVGAIAGSLPSVPEDARQHSGPPTREGSLKQFAQVIVAEIGRRQTEAPFGRLVIAAAPGVLNQLRIALTPELRASLVFELDRDLTSLPAEDLPAHLAGRARP